MKVIRLLLAIEFDVSSFTDWGAYISPYITFTVCDNLSFEMPEY
jgi:hypothetical protein